MRAIAYPRAPTPLSRACSPTVMPSLQYSGRLLPSAPSREAPLPTPLLTLVSEFQACEISPVSPREESGQREHHSNGSSAAATSKPRSASARSAGRDRPRSPARRHRRPGGGDHDQRDHDHDPERMAGRRPRGQVLAGGGQRRPAPAPSRRSPRLRRPTRASIAVGAQPRGHVGQPADRRRGSPPTPPCANRRGRRPRSGSRSPRRPARAAAPSRHGGSTPTGTGRARAQRRLRSRSSSPAGSASRPWVSPAASEAGKILASTA